MSTPSTSALALSPHRINAMVLRYLYLLRSSWSRVLDLIYWPAVLLARYGRDNLEDVFLDVARGRGEFGRGEAAREAAQ